MASSQKKNEHVGLHAHRFKDNPEEKRFADAWRESNETGMTLAHLLNGGAPWSAPPSLPTRERLVAATVVQWLGSPVGQSFLEDLGYEKKEKAHGK